MHQKRKTIFEHTKSDMHITAVNIESLKDVLQKFNEAKDEMVKHFQMQN